MLHLRRDETARIVFFGSLLLAHASAWGLALWLAPGLVPARQIVAETLSSSGLVLMSMNLVLSTRWRPLERLLCGLDKLFVTHRTEGLAVALFVSAHFMIVPKSQGFVITKLFSYPTFALVLTTVFLASAPRFPWRRLVPLKYQIWKAAHRFNGFYVLTASTHSLLAHTYVKQVLPLAAWVYGVAGVGLVAYVYRETLFSRFGPITRHEVASFRVLGGSVSELVLSPGGESKRAAGQFGVLSLLGGPTREQHPFTISSSPEDPYRFSVKASGDYTRQLLSGVDVGSGARVEGPYGAFSGGGHPRQLWLAGGIGITPFLSMARDLDDDVSVMLAWSVRQREEAVYESELREVEARKPNLRLILHCTSQAGHLDLASLDLAWLGPRFSAFICGPLPMRKASQRALRELGVRREDIHFEEFRLR